MAVALTPLQLSDGGGAEAVIHATRGCAINMSTDRVVVWLDFTNAFNTLRRDAVLEAMKCDVPELCRFAHATCTVELILQSISSAVRCCEGPQRGDPLSPHRLCIAIHLLLRRIGSVLRIRYLDDLTAGGRVDLVARGVELIRREAAVFGLQRNKAKNAQQITQKGFDGFTAFPFN
jgi:hypothetical protein